MIKTHYNVIKATDRIPDFGFTVHLNIDGRPGFGKFFERDGEKCLGFESTNGYGTLFDDQFEMVEWLEEAFSIEQASKISQP